MGLSEHFVPDPLNRGAHSSAGRASNNGMDKLREIAIELEHQSIKAAEARKEAAERIAVERAQGSVGRGGKPGAKPGNFVASSPTGADSTLPQEEDDAMPKRRQGPMADNSTPMGLAVRSGLNLGHGSPAAAADLGASAQSPKRNPLMDDLVDDLAIRRSEKLSPAFTSLAPDDQVFNEGATRKGRQFIQGTTWESNPEAGRYHINDVRVARRTTVMEFGARTPHPTRRKEELADTSRELGPEDLTAMDITWKKSGSMYAQPNMFSTMSATTRSGSMSETSQSWAGQSMMSTSTKRPALNNVIGSRNGLCAKITMNESNFVGDLVEQDKKTKHRPPVWDLTKQLDRKPFFGKMCEHFQPAKYAVKHESSKPLSKKHIGFEQQMSRSAPDFRQTKGLLDTKNGTTHHPDLSTYRQAPISKRRITHVMNMDKDTDRPPLIVMMKALHDENDPEVSRMVHEREMSFDADVVDRAVRSRSQMLNMSQSQSRDSAGHGARIAQGNISSTSKKGTAVFETTGQFSSTVEQLKDSVRLKSDVIVGFEGQKARGKTSLHGAYSPLRKPRHHAAPDFSRSPPLSGFSSRTPVKVLARDRSHDAMPGWCAEAVDNIMGM